MDAGSIHTAIGTLALLLNNGDNRFLDRFGLNRTQYGVLQLLHPQHGQRLVDLAAALLCERSTITRIIDHFEQAGLIQRHADADDRRSQRVVLTPAGVDLREQVQPLYAQSVQRRLRVLDDAEQRQLAALLGKVEAHLRTDLAVRSDA